MHKALHPKDDVDRIYMSRREGGRGLASIEDSLATLIQWLENYIKKHGGRLITATRNNTNNTRTSGMTITRKLKWEKKTTPRMFLVTNKRHLKRKNKDTVKKGNP